MTIHELQNKKIGILGLGVNNEELTRYLVSQGIRVTVREKKEESKVKFSEKYPGIAAQIQWEIGEKTLENLKNFDLVFRSPSIPYLSPALQKGM